MLSSNSRRLLASRLARAASATSMPPAWCTPRMSQFQLLHIPHWWCSSRPSVLHTCRHRQCIYAFPLPLHTRMKRWWARLWGRRTWVGMREGCRWRWWRRRPFWGRISLERCRRGWRRCRTINTFPEAREVNRKITYVASNVMYVPPMAGSAILAWKAEIATNMTVLVNVEKMCDKITVRRYHPWTPSFGNTITTNCATTAAIRRPMKAQHHTWIGGLVVDHRPAMYPKLISKGKSISTVRARSSWLKPLSRSLRFVTASLAWKPIFAIRWIMMMLWIFLSFKTPTMLLYTSTIPSRSLVGSSRLSTARPSVTAR